MCLLSRCLACVLAVVGVLAWVWLSDLLGGVEGRVGGCVEMSQGFGFAFVVFVRIVRFRQSFIDHFIQGVSYALFADGLVCCGRGLRG